MNCLGEIWLALGVGVVMGAFLAVVGICGAIGWAYCKGVKGGW